MQETNNRILVTGGAGFVGSNLIKRLRKNYPDAHIVSLDNYFTGSRDNHIPGVKYIFGHTINSHHILKNESLIQFIILVNIVELHNHSMIFKWQQILF